MNSGAFIAIYLPIFIVLFVMAPMNKRKKYIISKLKRSRGERVMSNEIIKSCIGKICTISAGSFGTSYSKVEVLEVADNWIKVRSSKGKIDLVNIDFVQNLKLHD